MKIRGSEIAILALFLVTSGLAWYFIALRRGIITAYYEWGATEMIGAYAEDNGWNLPSSWADLVEYEECTKHFNGDYFTIDDAKTHIRINFDSLKQLKSGKIAHLPKNTIVGLRGLDIHWINSSATLERLILKNEMPDDVYLKREMIYRRQRNSQNQTASPEN